MALQDVQEHALSGGLAVGGRVAEAADRVDQVRVPPASPAHAAYPCQRRRRLVGVLGHMCDRCPPQGRSLREEASEERLDVMGRPRSEALITGTTWRSSDCGTEGDTIGREAAVTGLEGLAGGTPVGGAPRGSHTPRGPPPGHRACPRTTGTDYCPGSCRRTAVERIVKGFRNLTWLDPACRRLREL